MVMASYYDPSHGRITVNLYCAQCEAQIGIFDNEWIRLTTSYARSQEKGTHFGTEVGNRTQTVPSGPAQRSAEGCVMAEVFCRKCSNMVGQYCKSAPDAEKQALVDQYFYKLSRTFLKDSRSNTRVEPVFGYGSDIAKSTNSGSSMAVRSSMTPNSRWAFIPLRQSSRTPAIPTPPNLHEVVQKELRGTPTVAATIKDERWAQTSAQIQKLQDEVMLQQSASSEQATQLSAQAQRLDEHKQRAKNQEASIEELDSCLSAQAARIVEQDELIKNQTNQIQQQQHHLATITNQLSKLQKSMDDLKKQLDISRSNSTTQNLGTRMNAGSNGSLDAMNDALRTAQAHSKEMQTLREENRAMKSRLNTIANAMGAVVDGGFAERSEDEQLPSTTASDARQVLGKRKRNLAGRPPSLELGSSIAPERAPVPSLEPAGQMPTPQSSDGGQSSPVQPVTSTRKRPVNKSRNARVPKNTDRRQSRADQTDEQEIVDQPVPGNEDNNATSNADEPYIALPNGDMMQEPQLNGSQGGVTRRARRSRTSGTFGRQKTRLSKASDTMEVAVTDDEISVLDPTKENDRRVTRAASRAARASDNITHSQNQTIEAESPLSILSVPSNQVRTETANLENDFATAEQSLPSVQMASSVLGINLGALIASSQALRKSVPPQQDQPDAASVNIEGESNEGDFLTANVDDECTFPTQDEVMTNPDFTVDYPQNEGDGIEIIQDTGIYDIIDSSDDDDDLMQANITLNSNNGCEAGDESLLTGDVLDINNPDRVDDQTGTNHGFTRQDRSMAPEPIRPKKTKAAKPSYKVNLDRIHLATPQMFTEAYAEGRRPREARPPAYSGRERLLNEELMKIGLSEWIGKDKSSREYRDAVAAARARWKNLNKQAYLWSRGLSHTLSGPASALPEEPVSRSATGPQNMPLSDIHNVPAPIETVPNVTVQDDENSHLEEEGQKEPPRTTRSRSRRNSMTLAPGLDEIESDTATHSRRAQPKRKSTGARQSKHKTAAVVVNVDELELEADTLDIIEDLVVNDTVMETSMMETSNQSIIGQQTAPRKRGRPKKTTVSNIVPSVDAVQPEEVVEQIGDQPSGADISLLEVPMNETIREKTQPQVSAPSKSLAQQREEAIMLRDRLAKELMEREDIDMFM